jgi:uncharacterized protein YlbG (UPF0298 family)
MFFFSHYSLINLILLCRYFLCMLRDHFTPYYLWNIGVRLFVTFTTIRYENLAYVYSTIYLRSQNVDRWISKVLDIDMVCKI